MLPLYVNRQSVQERLLRIFPEGSAHRNYCAAAERTDLSTTSSKPRYFLKRDFAALFDPSLVGARLDAAIGQWQATHLSQAALAMLALMQSGAGESSDGILVTFPNHETRRLSPGQSSVITKAVIEEFARRFLSKPAVLWLSESGNKVVARDDLLAKKIGLDIDPARNLPDIILVELGGKEFLLVFVEVVSTDGAVSELRRKELLKLVTDAGFDERHAAFVTAFMGRDAPAFRKSFASLAWNTFVWSASEPDRIVALLSSQGTTLFKLQDLLGGPPPRQED